MECLVRFSKEKYVRNGIVDSVPEGLKKMTENYIIPLYRTLNPHS